MGISPHQMRQLYQAVAVPSFTYAADVWFTLICRDTGEERFRGSIGTARKLSMVQHMATTAVTGALCTSASDVMEAHANLLPIELMLNKVCHRATLRLAALPETHPLFKPVRQSAWRFIKRHRSPLHHLFHAFNMRPSDCETIAPSVCPPNEDRAVWLHVAGMHEESREEDAEDEVDVRVYSDGLGIEGMAGTAAVLFRDGHKAKSIRYWLSPLMRHTTYEAEAVGVLLAVELVRRERGVHSATTCLDNQAVMQALGDRSAKPAQALLNLVHEGCSDWLDGDRRGRRQLSINWVSRHDGVHGNERADEEARKAASEGSSLEAELLESLQECTLPCSLAALGGKFKETLKHRWKAMWAKSPWKGRIDKIDDKLPSHSFLMATSQLTRAQASILMQLRTGHILLNYFLHKIGKVDSPTCQTTDETVHHYLLDCLGLVHECHSLAQAMGRNSKSMRHLLGNWHAYKALLKYVRTTGRFKDTYGDLPMRSTQADVSPPVS